jgi:3'-phosphoadenosine 5'-phosphosulfate sulfotransferase (PAPS reductase)/FAD synthetase
MKGISTTPGLYACLATGSPVAIGVSGGKDSCAMALALSEWLDHVGHCGPRLLVHADLGRTEWKDSWPTCERLARACGLELLVVRRQQGDMLARWQQRWRDNVERYQTLSCVKLILPWSTPDMRFCTSELKVDVICRALVARWPNCCIVSASGIRADESSQRARAPVWEEQEKLQRVRANTTGFNWHPLLGWSAEDVFGHCRERGFAMHEAYARYGSSRVSCVYCILGSKADLRAAAGCADNHDVYREMVDLEIASTFAFKGNEWLSDVAPHLLSGQQCVGVVRARRGAHDRETAELRIPAHLLYTRGWPTCVPTRTEAGLLAEVRTRVARAVGLDVEYTDGRSVLRRYEELMALKKRKES